jgi:anti-sigma factor RsiW
MLDFLRRIGKSEHEWVEESLSAYLDGELSAREKAGVEKHLKECRACSENLSTLRQTVALLKELPAVPAPRSFALRPAMVKPKVRVAPPSWGYGLLKGATALAALLLVLVIGGDLTLQFLGSFPLGAPAPPPPAEEMSAAPSVVPSEMYAPAEGEPRVGEGRDAEAAAETVPPPGATELPTPAPAPPEPPDGYQAPSAQDVASPEVTVEGTPPACTPTAEATPGPPTNEQEEVIGAGKVEGTVTPADTPSPATTPGREEAEPTPEPEVTGVPEAEKREAICVPSETSEVVAAAEPPAEEPRELDVTYYQPGISLPSPFRLAELILFALLMILVPATVLTGWWIRRQS